MPQRILALEMPGNVVRGALGQRTWNSLHLLGAFEEERRTGEPDLSGALTRLLQRIGKPDLVISALPGEFVVKRLLELPFADVRRLNQVVPFALEEHLPFPVDDAVAAFVRVGADRSHTLVIAALARKPDLRRHLETLAKAGLDPKTVTLSELAIAALLGRSANRGSRAQLVIDIEAGSTSMVLVDSDGTPRAMRTVPAGIEPTKDAPLAHQPGASIVSAARQTLLAHSSSGERFDVMLTGSAAAVASVRKQIAEALALSVRDAADLDCAPLLNGQRPDMSRFAGCVAMLMGELPARPTEMLNFRCGEFAFRGRIRGDLKPFYATGILAALVAIFAVAHLALEMGSALHRLHLIDRELAAIAAPALGSAAPHDTVAALRTGTVRINKRLALLGGGSALVSPLDALLAVSRDIPKGLQVVMEDVAIDGSGVRLSGEADSFASIDRIKKLLSEDNYFGSVEVMHAKAATNGTVEFQLNLLFRDVVTGE